MLNQQDKRWCEAIHDLKIDYIYKITGYLLQAFGTKDLGIEVRSLPLRQLFFLLMGTRPRYYDFNEVISVDLRQFLRFLLIF